MKSLFSCMLLLATLNSYSQDSTLYHPNADAAKELKAAVKKAGKENKFVLIQAGGNWCPWCIEFARFAKADNQIDSLIKADFVWYHLNYSKENRNEALFARYDYPQRFGFPVFIILDGKGKRIHTQNSEYLEDGKKSYSKEKVMSFLKMWRPAALNAENYASKK